MEPAPDRSIKGAYPELVKAPSVDDCLKAFTLWDGVWMTGTVGLSWTYGYVMGYPLRRPAAGTAAAIGTTFVSLYYMQDKAFRLKGYKRNIAESKRFPEIMAKYAEAKKLKVEYRQLMVKPPEDRAVFKEKLDEILSKINDKPL